MKRQVLIYGLLYGVCGGLLIFLLKLIEFRFLVVEHSLEIYSGLIALLFAGVGIWKSCMCCGKPDPQTCRQYNKN